MRCIVVTLDVAYVACSSKSFAFSKKSDVLILLLEIITISLDIFNEVLGLAVIDLIVA